MILGTDLQHESMVTILRSANTNKNVGLFNNAAQSYNHAFYWECMCGNAAHCGGMPDSNKSEKHKALVSLIESSFGSYEIFKKKFIEAGVGVFGSGWVWLVWTPSGLEVIIIVTVIQYDNTYCY